MYTEGTEALWITSSLTGLYEGKESERFKNTSSWFIHRKKLNMMYSNLVVRVLVQKKRFLTETVTVMILS